jgi:hypothetical protein
MAATDVSVVFYFTNTDRNFHLTRPRKTHQVPCKGEFDEPAIRAAFEDALRRHYAEAVEIGTIKPKRPSHD